MTETKIKPVPVWTISIFEKNEDKELSLAEQIDREYKRKRRRGNV